MSDAQRLSLRGNVASVVVGVLVVIPGMIVSGFMPELDVFPLWAWCVVTGFGGLLAGAIGIEQRPVLGALSGLVGCVATAPAILVYVDWRAHWSSSFLSVEFLLPAFVAMLPGFAVFALGRRLAPDDVSAID